MTRYSFIELKDEVQEKTGLPGNKTSETIHAFLMAVVGALARGESVTLYGVGTFKVKRCSSRLIEDFRGQRHVTPGRKVSFRPSKSFRSILS